MSKSNRKRKATRQEDKRSSQADARSRKRLPLVLFGVLMASAGIAVLAFVFTGNSRTDSGSARASQAEGILSASNVKQSHQVSRLDNHNDSIKLASLQDLLDLPVKELANVDIAEMNLFCATGLPGAEKLDIDHALTTLDQWAQRVKFETDRHLYRAHDPRWADHYRHSEAYLRAEFLVQVLYEDLGVRYNLAAKDNFDFDDSRVAFIHGMIPAPGQTLADTPGGTCASMPVMVAAVGRRLGYPLKLATTQGHVFVRWDGQGHSIPAWRERFNMEVTNGFSSYGDDHYKSWPFELTEAQVKANRYLVSLSPAETFAGFLAARGHCGMDNGQIGFAARCYENAYRYDTTRPIHQAFFLDAAMKSGYRPATATLARMLAKRINRIASTRRSHFDPMAMPKPSEMARANALSGLPTAGVGHNQPQIPQSHVLQIPQTGFVQPGFAQPYQQPVPGQPPR